MKEKQSVKSRLLKDCTHLILELPAFLLGGGGAGLLFLAVKRYHQKQQTPGAGTADTTHRERACAEWTQGGWNGFKWRTSAARREKSMWKGITQSVKQFWHVCWWLTFLAEAVCCITSFATVKVLADGPLTKFLMRCMVFTWFPVTGARARREGVLDSASFSDACCLAIGAVAVCLCCWAGLPRRNTLSGFSIASNEHKRAQIRLKRRPAAVSEDRVR